MSYTQPDFLKNGGDAYRINAKSNERSRAEMCVFISVTSCAGARRLLESSLNKLQIKIIEKIMKINKNRIVCFYQCHTADAALAALERDGCFKHH